MISLSAIRKNVAKLDKILGLLAVISVFCLIFVMAHIAILDSDIWLHLKTGELIWQNKLVPQQDIFSFTFPSKPWVDHEPLFQLISYFVYSRASADGLILLSCYVIFLAFFLLFLMAHKKLNSYFEAALLLFAAGLASVSRFNIRPDIFSVLFLCIYLYLLMFYINKNALWLLIPVQVLWVNFHGYFFLGPLTLFFFILAEFIRRSSPKLPWDWKKESPLTGPVYKRLQIIFILSILASLVNPSGIKGALYPVYVFKDIFIGKAKIFFSYIRELQPTFNIKNYSWDYYYLLVFLCFGSLILNFKRLKIVEIFLSVFFFIFALTQRNIVFFVAAAFFILPRYAAGGLSFIQRKLKVEKAKPAVAYYLVRICLILIFIVWIWLRIDRISLECFYNFDTKMFVSTHIGVLEKHYPKEAVDFILGNNINGNMLNDFNSGAYLIGRAGPARKVFIDGRTEFYGDKFFKEYQDAVSGDEAAFKKLEGKYNISGVLLTETSSGFPGLAKVLIEKPEWRLVFFDEIAAVFLKDTLSNKELIKKFGIDFNKYQPPKTDLRELAALRVFPLPYIKRAKFFYLIKKDALVISEAKEALRIMPDSYEAFRILGKAYLRTGSYEDAFLALRSASILMPRNAGILADLGGSLIMLKDYKAAEKTLKAALRLRKNYPLEHYESGRPCNADISKEQALKVLEEVKECSLGDAELREKIFSEMKKLK